MAGSQYSSAERAALLNGNEEIKINFGAVCTFLHFQGQHGIIEKIINREEISRSTLMRQVDRVLDVFGPDTKRSTLKAEIHELKKENQALRKQLQKEQEKNAHLTTQIEQITACIEKRKIKLMLLAAVLNNSLRDIASLVSCAFDEPMSHMTVFRTLAEYERKATELMEEHFSIGIENGCLDEIFFHQNPVLVIVEALSHCIMAIEKKESRSSADWNTVIEKLAFLKQSVNDKGCGILGALKHKEIPFQIDVFHCLQQLTKGFNKFEKRTYALITRLEKLKEQQRRLKSDKSTSRRKATLSRELHTAQAEFEVFADTYDLTDWIVHEIHRVFDWFQANGHLNTAEYLRATLAILCEWLAELAPEYFRKFIRYVSDSEVATYLVNIHQKLAAIDTHNPFGVSHTLLTEHLGRMWCRHEKKPIHVPVHVQLIDTVLQHMLPQWDGYQHLRDAVFDAFNSTPRSSAAVENVNSRLRLSERIKKHVSQWFLSLVALYHNLTPFKDGAKRQGKSPAQLLKNLQLPSFDFFQLLGLHSA